MYIINTCLCVYIGYEVRNMMFSVRSALISRATLGKCWLRASYSKR